IFGDTAKDENKLTYGKRLGPADSPYKISVQSEGGLSLSERGFTFAIFLVPPQWCSENWEKINDAISPKLSRLFMRQLAEKIKSEYWGEPSTEVKTEKADPETPEKVTPDNFDDFLEELFPGE
ncbi:MAG: hypothetical protein KAI63_03245, partial [Planctomycetes bacterium]|nr:hypothetical protein [Planctomycetota bacterium]